MYDLYHIDLSKLNGNISREQEVNMKAQKSYWKFWVETSPFRGGSRRLLQFPSLVCPPFVSSRYGASEKSMAR